MGFKLDDHYEKDFFSYSEIAARWDCDVSDILYLLYETRELRNAYKVKTPPLFSLSKCQNQEEVDILGLYIWLYTDSISRDKWAVMGFPIYKGSNDAEASSGENCFVQSQLFESGFSRSIRDEPIYIYEDIGNDFSVYGPDYETLSAYVSARNFDGTWLLLAEFKPEVITSSIISKSEFNLITREERDRFEKKYGITQETENVQIQVSVKNKNIGNRPTAQRDIEIQEAAESLASEFKREGSKAFTKREIANHLSSNDEWKEFTAGRLERIIRKTW